MRSDSVGELGSATLPTEQRPGNKPLFIGLWSIVVHVALLMGQRPKLLLYVLIYQAIHIYVYILYIYLEAPEKWRPCTVAHVARAKGRPCVWSRSPSMPRCMEERLPAYSLCVLTLLHRHRGICVFHKYVLCMPACVRPAAHWWPGVTRDRDLSATPSLCMLASALPNMTHRTFLFIIIRLWLRYAALAADIPSAPLLMTGRTQYYY